MLSTGRPRNGTRNGICYTSEINRIRYTIRLNLIPYNCYCFLKLKIDDNIENPRQFSMKSSGWIVDMSLRNLHEVNWNMQALWIIGIPMYFPSSWPNPFCDSTLCVYVSLPAISALYLQNQWQFRYGINSFIHLLTVFLICSKSNSGNHIITIDDFHCLDIKTNTPRNPYKEEILVRVHT